MSNLTRLRGNPPALPTKRELEVAHLFAQGLDNKAMSARLGVTHWTVRELTRLLLRRIGAKNRAHAVYLLIQQGHMSTDTAAKGAANGQ